MKKKLASKLSKNPIRDRTITLRIFLPPDASIVSQLNEILLMLEEP